MDLEKITVSEFMSHECYTAQKTDKIGATDILMTRKQVGGVPVVNGSNRILGIITQRDITLSKISSNVASMTVQDLMTVNVVTCKESDTLKHVIQLMHDHDIERVPVINDTKQLIGMVVQSDVIQLLYKVLVEKA